MSEGEAKGKAKKRRGEKREKGEREKRTSETAKRVEHEHTRTQALYLPFSLPFSFSLLFSDVARHCSTRVDQKEKEPKTRREKRKRHIQRPGRKTKCARERETYRDSEADSRAKGTSRRYG